MEDSEHTGVTNRVDYWLEIGAAKAEEFFAGDPSSDHSAFIGSYAVACAVVLASDRLRELFDDMGRLQQGLSDIRETLATRE